MKKTKVINETVGRKWITKGKYPTLMDKKSKL